MGPGDLARTLAGLPFQSHPNLIAGMERSEDAGVFKLTDDLAIVQTVDFFTPIVDDPYDFGRITVANSLSDVYAMGARPLTALNVVCFPQAAMDFSVLRKVLEGGLDMMHEADVILLGGHTVDDPELKYGLSVTGVIHPDKVVHNNAARPGDVLVLTKPIGTGIISTAIKAGTASPAAIKRITDSMAALNRAASEAMVALGAHACKDVTGFGLLGHAAEMIEGTHVGMEINSAAVPLFPETKEYYEKGMFAAGLRRNRAFRKNMVTFAPSVPDYLQDLLFDPQTSGGLLIALPASKAPRLQEKLKKSGIKAPVIGKVVAQHKSRIKVI
ncbi:MAG: selenide, water dikinase SelD [Dehalococcoidales bacterium]|nr:selenide, water dikinase SelD [Dehalococcoidales bacterium]